jgi:hypothetical protein
MNSSRAPETQSFCLGVWTKTRTFAVLAISPFCVAKRGKTVIFVFMIIASKAIGY